MIEKHSRERQIELGRSMQHRRKVYLDACFWIILREVESGIRTGADERKLLHLLRRGVRSGALICPISTTMFLELMKQPYTATRRQATAKLIDELSLGVTSVEPQRLMATEVHRFLLATRGVATLHPMQELIWTKVSYVLGDHYPTIDQISKKLELEIQIKFFDYLWEMSIPAFIDLVSSSDKWQDNYPQLSKEINRKNSLHRDELRSFEMAYDAEIRGICEIAGELVANSIERSAVEAGVTQKPTAEERSDTVKMGRNLLYYAMRNPEYRLALRTLHVGASIHAGMRWDKDRKFKPNDWYDFGHAEIAMTYCDAFFTEAPLHQLITRPQLDLEKINGCRVASDVSVAGRIVRDYLSA